MHDELGRVASHKDEELANFLDLDEAAFQRSLEANQDGASAQGLVQRCGNNKMLVSPA